MAEVLKERLNELPVPADRTALRKLIEALIDSHESVAQKVDALVVVYNATLAKLDVLTTKMNADAGITDADYATNFAAANPGVGGAETALDAFITK